MVKDELTKSDLEQLLGEQTKIILGAVDEKLSGVKTDIVLIRADAKEIKADIGLIQESIGKLTNALDAFLARLTKHEQEFEIIKAEMRTIKEVLKNKFQIDIDAIRHT